MHVYLQLHGVAPHASLFGLLAEWVLLERPCCTRSRSWCFYTAMSSLTIYPMNLSSIAEAYIA